MIEIIKGGIEMNEYIDFINKVFDFKDGRDFRTLLPKLFADGKDSEKDTYFLVEDGEVKACVLVYPIEYEICGEKVRMGGIGNVATRLDCRGRGFMKMLMDKAASDMEKDGFDMSVLGGRRHRYNIHGYEKCDCNVHFNMSKKIFQYISPDFKPEFTMKQVQSADDQVLRDIYEAIKSGKAMADYKPVRELSTLYDLLRSWNSRVYGFYKNGEFKGWATTNKDGDWSREFMPLDPADTKEMATQLITEVGVNRFSMPTFLTQINSNLMQICENASYECMECFSVYNFKKVLSLLLKLKAKEGICDGTLDIEVEEFGGQRTRLLMKVENGVPSVTEYNSEKAPEYSFNHLEAERFFFLNCSPERMNIKPCLKTWFPLPIYIYEADNV